MEPVLVCGIFLLAGAFIFWYLIRRAEGQKKSVEESWGNLARLTGLVYIPGGTSLLGIQWASEKPIVCGTYRGRQLRLTLVTGTVSFYDGDVALASTTVSLKINNRTDRSLVVHERGLLPKLFGRGQGASDIEGLDPRFTVTGRPWQSLQKAQSLVARMTFERTTMGANRSPFFWTSQSKLPSITLKGSDLIWEQYDVVVDVNELSELFKLMSDLADLVEEKENLLASGGSGL